jgi:hypothetical protein
MNFESLNWFKTENENKKEFNLNSATKGLFRPSGPARLATAGWLGMRGTTSRRGMGLVERA